MAANGPLKWHGGKSYLAQWIRENAPPPGTYTLRIHGYAGGLGELWGWDHEGIAEAVNDLNLDLVTFYGVLQEPKLFEEFARIVALTPFGELPFQAGEWAMSNMPPRLHIGRAAAFFVLNRMSRQGLGKDYANPTTRTRRGMMEHVSAYLSAVDSLPEFHERLRRVEVRHMPALELIETYDHERAFFYLDPPYLFETRTSTGEYGPHEMTKADHAKLLTRLLSLQGKFLLSGYPSKLYSHYAEKGGWRCVTKTLPNQASGKKKKDNRTECLWMNYAAT
jgi:DNA adenine methylase